MAQHARMQNADGSITVVNLDDGSAVIWEPGMTTVKGYLDANPQRAAALRTGDPAEIRAAQEQLDAQQRDLEQQLFEYGERAYGDTRSDREADIKFRNRQLQQSGDYQNRSLDQSGRQFDQNLDQRKLEHQDSVNQALQDLGLRQASLGQQIVNTATNLGEQPEDWLKLSKWYRNQSGQPGVPVFAQKLLEAGQGNLVQGLPAYSNPGQGATPQGNSIAKVIAKLTGDGTIDHRSAAAMMLLGDQGFSEGQGMNPDDVALANSIQSIAKMGGAKVAPIWQTLDPTEQKMILGGMGPLDAQRFQRDTLRGLPGQGNPNQA